MTSNSSDMLHAWAECVGNIGEQNRAMVEELMRLSRLESAAFLQQRLEQSSQAAERMQHNASGFFTAGQDFMKDALGAWTDQAQKWNGLMWQAAESRMKQTAQTIAATTPPSSGVRRARAGEEPRQAA